MMSFSRKSLTNRIIAGLLSFVMMLSLVMNVTPSKAATEAHPGYITITVKDSDGNALPGATVAFELVDETAEHGVIASGNVTTDENGTVEVLSVEAYSYHVSCTLKLSATVSKDGYITNDTDIASTVIVGSDMDVSVTLNELPEITGITVTPHSSTYQDMYQTSPVDAVNVTGTVEGDTISYKLGDEGWSSEVPKIKNAGTYNVSVKVERTDCKTFETNVTATINKANLPSDMFNVCDVTYDGNEHKSVTATEKVLATDNVTYTYNSTNYIGKDNAPSFTEVGNYAVAIVVKRDNYNDYSTSVTAKINPATISDQDITVTTGANLVYNGEDQQLIIAITDSKNKATFEYSFDNSNWNTYSAGSIVGQDAGEYHIWIKAKRPGHNDKVLNNGNSYNVVISKKQQTITFDASKYSANIDCDGVNAVEDIDYSAHLSSDIAEEAVIKYSVVNDTPGDTTSIDYIATIDEDTGLLSILKGGYNVKIIATVTNYNTDNYTDAKAEIRLTIKNTESNLLTFANPQKNYTVSSNTTVSNQTAVKKYNNANGDNGVVTYSAKVDGSTKSLDKYGLQINENTGLLEVISIKNLNNSVKNGPISLVITAKKTNGTKKNSADETKTVYNSDEVTYKVTILKPNAASLPTGTFKMFDDNDDEITSYNGTIGKNGEEWYKTAVTIKVATGFVIDKDMDEVAKNSCSATSVVFDDQNTEADTRVVFIKDTTTKAIYEIELPIEYIDSEAPDAGKLTIEYSDAVAKKDGISYYDKDGVKVTFTGEDTTSGIKYFTYKYTRAEGASTSNVDKYTEQKVDVQKIEGNKFTASIVLPKEEAEQLKGYLSVTATDWAGNTSATKTDSGKVFVVDSISPTRTVTYQLKDGKGTQQLLGSKEYYSNDVEFTFDVKEINFFADDVEVFVAKNGATPEKKTLSWNKTSTDKYSAMLTLSGEGDYVVSMKYTDRSKNEMKEYTSKTIIIDKTKPVISFAFDKESQTATVTIKEHNFRKDDIVVKTDAKNIAGDKLSANDIQKYLRECNWTKDGDTYTTTISKSFRDAIYTLTFDYKDLALNPATTVKTNSFVVDKTAPDYTKMSVTYSQPITEQLLSTLTFGYYNPNVKVTFTAYDVVSGVDFFTWSYNKQAGASDTNLDKYAEQKVKAVQDSKDKTKFTATITLPLDEAKQLRGSIAYQATDKYANSSKKLTDSGHVIVVDTIAPNVKAEYAEPVKTVGSKKYYNKEVAITFNVKEANFDKKDVKVVVTKNGTEVNLNTTWKDTDVDNHVGSLIIPANADHSNDGDYVVTVNYTDKSNNKAKEVKLGTFVVDTTNPIIDVAYANANPVYTTVDDGNSRDYFDATQTATVKITERNFNSSNVKFIITAKDVAGNDYNVDNFIKKSAWTSEGNVHTMTITYPGDANYSFDVEYTDEATNVAANYATDYFTVDKTAPTNLNVDLSDSLLNTVLQNVTFGFYNAKVTVTVTAEDTVSRVHKFEYNAKNATGVSSVNAEIIKQAIEEADITYTNGGKTATAKFEIPRAALGATNQFNGSVDFIAIDRSNNESEDYKDSTRIVVDNISPVADVQYNEAVNKADGVSYYDGNITSTITITEANFFADDVKVTATKNGTNYPINVTWSDESVDKHVGTFTLSEDGDYIVSIEYKDKSNNSMASYKSSQLTIDTALEKPVITVNGEDGNNKAYKDSVVPGIKFNDINLDKYEVKLLRTVYDKKDADVTEEFISGNLTDDGKAVDATFDVFEKIKENDGIYTLSVNVWDKANHQATNEITFSVNRFGSVYVLDGVADVKNNFYNKKEAVNQDIVITEYNADVLDYSKISINITRDGKPVETPVFTITPAEGVDAVVGENGWYEYKYVIDKSNFQNDGLYKISVTSEDKAGNTPQNTGDNDIQFYVDNTAPEITSITGLEKDVINATEVVVKYTVFDAVGLKTVTIYVDGKAVDTIKVEGDDINNYSGEFKLSESTSEQKVVIVVEDLAGNKISTAGAGNGETKGDVDFDPAFKFNESVTVSTNFFVRWYANKAAFWGSIIGFIAVVGGAVFGVITLKKKKEQ